MTAENGGRRCRWWATALMVGSAIGLLGCADDGGVLGDGAATPSVSAADETAEAEPSAAPSDEAASTPLVISAEGGDADPAGDLSADGTDEGSATAPDAAPLSSDESGDVPAGPPAPGSPADDGSVVGADDAPDADDPTTAAPEDDPTDGADPGADRPEPPVDTDTSPDDGEVPNGVSGDTEVRENLQYPDAGVTNLGTGSATTLADQLAGANRPTLLWFWTPDCPTCVPESSAVADFARAHGDTIRVLGVGAGGSRAEADAFAAAASVDAGQLVWEAGSATHQHYNVTAAPFAIMVAPNGVVMAQWRGMVPELFAFADRL